MTNPNPSIQEQIEGYIITAKVNGEPYRMMHVDDVITVLAEMQNKQEELENQIEYWKTKHDLTANSLMQEIEGLRRKSNN